MHAQADRGWRGYVRCIGPTQVKAHYGELGARGLRGLLIGSRSLPANALDAAGELSGWVGELTFTGLVGLTDPPREEAKVAIAHCLQAGIAVKMITGHHQHTATEIAAELGFTGNTLTGAELDRMDANQLATAIDAISVFARGTPFNKVKIARAAKQRPRGGNDG